MCFGNKTEKDDEPLARPAQNVMAPPAPLSSAPTSKPPPHAQQDQEYAPPAGPPPSYQPAVHDWQSAVPDTSLFPPPPAIFSGHDRSANNATEEEAEAGEAWCARYPLPERPMTLDPAGLEALRAHDISLISPAGFAGRLRRLGPGHWEAQTPRHAADGCITGYPPLYAANHRQDPSSTTTTTTIYYEVKVRPGRGGEVHLALGFAALPYPPFRLPGWHRGSLAVHGDDGRKYVNDRWGGRDFTQAFREGETYGVGMVFGGKGGVEVFFTRGGVKVGGWDLYEETDAETDLPVTGLEGFHDLSCAIGVFEDAQFEVVFDPSRCYYFDRNSHWCITHLWAARTYATVIIRKTSTYGALGGNAKALMDIDSDNSLLGRAVAGESIDETVWPTLRADILTRLDKIAHGDFPIPQLPRDGDGALPRQIEEQLAGIKRKVRTFEPYPPHTIQRLAELMLRPRAHYKALAAYLHAVDRVVQVTSGTDTYPLPLAVPDMSRLRAADSNGDAHDPAAQVSWTNPAAAVGSDEALGGALLTPIPWLARRNSSPDESAAGAQIHSEGTETIDGPNGVGSIETVSVSVNGVPSTGHARGVTQGELLRQEQRAGVVPVSQLSRHNGFSAAHHPPPHPHATTEEEGIRKDEAEEEEEQEHARGPEEIGVGDTGPQPMTTSVVGEAGVEMGGIDLEAAVGRRREASPAKREAEEELDEAAKRVKEDTDDEMDAA